MSDPTNTQGPQGVDYSTWADADLRRRAGERGLRLRNDTGREELIEAVRRSDDALATLNEPGGDVIEGQEGDSAYDDMTVTELRHEADARGIALPARATKAELIDALEAADGMTEGAQAAANGVDYDGE